MLAKLMSFIKDEEGVTMVEYALILALVAIVAITAWKTLGTGIKNAVTEAGDEVTDATGGG
ncbi:MAG: Flp family type IVb pilin [Armatimonadota bacterium]|jgi:pilus assembly protein Flp/PilA